MRSVSWPKPETPSRLWKGPSCRLCSPQPGDLYFNDIYITEQAAQHNNDTVPDRVYEIWFDDIVLATEYIGGTHGVPKAGKKAATPGRSALQAAGSRAAKAIVVTVTRPTLQHAPR